MGQWPQTEHAISSLPQFSATWIIKYKFDNQLFADSLFALKQQLYQTRLQEQQRQEEPQGQAGGKGSKRKYTRRYVKK